MIKEQGIIEKVHKDKAVIRVNRTSACAACKSQDSCHMEKRDILVEVTNDLQARSGDHVELSMPEGAIMRLSMLVYLFPVIALLIGAFAGASLGEALQLNTSVSALVCGALAVVIVFLLLKKLERKPDFRKKYQAHITRILASANSPFHDDNI